MFLGLEGSSSGFFSKGLTKACFMDCGKIPRRREVLNRLVGFGRIVGRTFKISLEGNESDGEKDLLEEDIKERTSSSETKANEDRVFGCISGKKTLG